MKDGGSLATSKRPRQRGASKSPLRWRAALPLGAAFALKSAQFRDCGDAPRCPKPHSAGAQPLWQPSRERIAAANVTGFAARVARDRRRRARRFRRAVALVGRPAGGLLARAVGLRRRRRRRPGERGARERRPRCRARGSSRGAAQLRREPAAPAATTTPALDLLGRGQVERRVELAPSCTTRSSRLRRRCARAGVRPGDRVAGYLPNMPETIIAMLAAASLGAVWSSCSPDFGVQGVLDRFGQIEPKVLFAVDGYLYGGKTHRRARQAAPRSRRSCRRVERVVVVPYAAATRRSRARARRAALWTTSSAPHRGARRSTSRGCRSTTRSTSSTRRARPGVPKCIVHGAGGTLLQHLKEHLLHCDVKPRRPPVLLHHLRLDDVELARLGPRRRRDAAALRRLAVPSRRQRAVRLRRARAGITRLRHLGQVHRRAAPRPGSSRRKTHELATRARDRSRPARRSSPESFDYVYGNDQARRCSSPRSRAAPTSSPASCSAIRPCRCGAARSRRRGLGMAVEVFDDDGRPVARREGRAGLHGAVPVDAGRLLERPRRQQVPRRLLRALPGRLVPRRLRRADRARRRDHLRPLRRGAQPGRRAHRHRRDLPPGRAARRGGRGARDRPGLGGRRARRAVRAPARRRWRSTTRCAKRIRDADPQQHHAAPRAGEDRAGRRHPAHQERQDRRARRARRRARPRRSRTARRSPIPRRWSSTRTCRR